MSRLNAATYLSWTLMLIFAPVNNHLALNLLQILIFDVLFWKLNQPGSKQVMGGYVY